MFYIAISEGKDRLKKFGKVCHIYFAAFAALNSLIISHCLSDCAVAGTVSVRPELSLTEMYDSNPDSIDGGDGSFVSVVSPRITAVNERRSANLNLTYGLTSRFYHQDHDLDYTSHSISAGAAMEVTQKTRLSLEDTFLYTRESLEASESGVETGRSDIITNTASLTLRHQYSTRVSYMFNVSDSIQDYDDSGLTDTRTDSGSLTWAYVVNQNNTISLNYIYSNIAYNPAGDGKDVVVQSASAGYESIVSPSLRYSITAGSTLVSDPEADDDEFYWTGSAEIEKEFKKSTLSVRYSRSIVSSSGTTEEAVVRQTASLLLSVRMTDRLVTDASGSISDSRSEPSGDLDVVSYTAGLSLRWQAKPWLSLTSGYSHFEQWSDGPDTDDISRETVYVTLTAAPEEWRF